MQHIWSVDNRRLLGVRLEGSYIQHQSTTRFQELLKKHRGLSGVSGEEATFRRDAPLECCVDAWDSESFDEHLAVVHLKMTLYEIKLL